MGDSVLKGSVGDRWYGWFNIIGSGPLARQRGVLRAPAGRAWYRLRRLPMKLGVAFADSMLRILIYRLGRLGSLERFLEFLDRPTDPQRLRDRSQLHALGRRFRHV